MSASRSLFGHALVASLFGALLSYHVFTGVAVGEGFSVGRAARLTTTPVDAVFASGEPGVHGRHAAEDREQGASAPLPLHVTAVVAVLAVSVLTRRPQRSVTSSAVQGCAQAVRSGPRVVRCAAEPSGEENSESDALADARAAAELARLELEAAKLRAEAKQLEDSITLDRRKTRAQRIMGPDAKSVDLETLCVRLRDIEGFVCGKDDALKLVAACNKGPDGKVTLQMTADGSFSVTLEDVMSEAFNVELDKLKAESVAAKRKAEAEEREARARIEEQQRQRQDQVESDPFEQGEINDDRSIGPRILGILAYFLPLIDAAQFIVPMAQDNEALAIALAPIALVSALINIIPFGSFLFLVVFIFAAQYKPFPRLVRFNLEQSVLLTIAGFLPSLLIVGASAVGAIAAVPALGALAFFIDLAIVLYCWGRTAVGEVPDGIPIISDTTKNVVDRGSFGGEPPEQRK